MERNITSTMNDREYMERFQTCVRYGMNGMGNNNYREKYQSEINKVFENLKRQPANELRVLAIGSGNGGYEKCYKAAGEFFETTKYLGSSKVKAVLDTVAPAAKIQNITYHCIMNITECFDEVSEEGNKMLDFIFYILHFRKSVPSATVQYLLKYLKEECSEVTEKSVLMNADDTDFVVVKN
ncbi:histamine N-methyltransferase-like [Glandiceps talaboti]